MPTSDRIFVGARGGVTVSSPPSQEEEIRIREVLERYWNNTAYPDINISCDLDNAEVQEFNLETQPIQRRSEYDMLREYILSEEFPKPNFQNWQSSGELSGIVDNWYRHVEYKEQWIFSRREREGFNRRNIGQFSLDDVLARISKRRSPHPLDTSNSKIYDWNLGGTDWTLRLELHTIEGVHGEDLYFLICRHIYKPKNVEVKYEVRHWNGDRFKTIVGLWSEWKDNDKLIEKHLLNNNSASYENPFDMFVADDCCDEDDCCEDDCCDDDYNYSYCGENEAPF